jgi:hypothetical protein
MNDKNGSKHDICLPTMTYDVIFLWGETLIQIWTWNLHFLGEFDIRWNWNYKKYCLSFLLKSRISIRMIVIFIITCMFLSLNCTSCNDKFYIWTNLYKRKLKAHAIE